MTIKLLVVGKTDVSLLEKIIEDYRKRLQFYIKFEIEIIPDLKNTKNISQEEQKNKEGVLLLKQIAHNDLLILF